MKDELKRTAFVAAALICAALAAVAAFDLSSRLSSFILHPSSFGSEATMFPIIITITERDPADLSARAHREISRGCFARIGQVWQSEILPPRFTPNSPAYPHKPRTRRYLDQKQKDADRGKVLFGGQVLNVRTGNMKEILSRPGVVRAFPTRATVSKVGPRYITMRPFKSNQPDKWAELTWLSEQEKRRLHQEAGATYDRLRAQVNETRHFSTG